VNPDGVDSLRPNVTKIFVTYISVSFMGFGVSRTRAVCQRTLYLFLDNVSKELDTNGIAPKKSVLYRSWWLGRQQSAEGVRPGFS